MAYYVINVFLSRCLENMDMKKNTVYGIIKICVGIAVILCAVVLIKNNSQILKALAPGAIREYIQSFGRIAALVYIAAYTANTISILPPIGPLSIAGGLAFGTLLGG
ncbi:MAG: hypothetical protein ABH883_07515, partial [Candidatus Omnitrophota bacterium]